MKSLRRFWLKFTALFRSPSLRDQDLTDEIETNLQLHIDDNLRSGMDPQEARRQAILTLGGVEPAKEAYRDARTFPLLENAIRDTRFALRQLKRNPGFAVTSTLTLSLGVCASLTLFAFVDSALLKPLPYPDPSRLVAVNGATSQFPTGNLSYLDYLDWKASTRLLRSIDVYTGAGYIIQSGGRTESVRAARVSDGFFRTLGVIPFLGRDFYKGEDLPSAGRTVILTYGCWQTRFNGSKEIIGKSILLTGVPHTVVGVLPASFQFALRGQAEMWTTIHANSGCDMRRSCHNMFGIGRLNDGVSISAALGEMKSIAKQLEREYPDSNRGQSASVVPLSELIVGNVRPILLVLLSGGLLLLMISCINVASLVLARAEARRREIAVRSSLGASSLRLLSQLVTESCVLILASNLTGLLLAAWLMQSCVRLIPPDMLAGMPFLIGLHVNSHVLAFALFIALFAAFLFSFIPALHFRISGMQGLHEGTRGSAGRSWRRLGSHLVVVELTVAMVLLVGAGLLAKSLTRLLNVDLGFDPAQLAIVIVALPDNPYNRPDRLVGFSRDLVSRVSALPGVESVGLVDTLPVRANGNTNWIRVEGYPFHGEHNEVNTRDVSPQYIPTLHARLLRGRTFRDDEDLSKPRVVIINETFAKKYFAGEDPIGKRIGDTSLSPASLREVIGVVADIREGTLDSDIWPAEYQAFNQNIDTYFAVIARTSTRAEAALPAITALLRNLEPGAAVIDQNTMTQRISDLPSTYMHRSSAWLVGGFALSALLLGAIGLYGVIAYSVTQRTREIGIRMALGAEQTAVHRLILQEARRLTVRGLLLGLLCSLGAAALIRNLLFAVSSWDMQTLAGVSLLLVTCALLATYIPARRAAAVDPVEALRAE